MVVVDRGLSEQEQEQSTSIECQYECPCRQHAQRVSGVADYDV